MIKAELIDYMGSDLTVVNAARVSFAKHHEEFKDGETMYSLGTLVGTAIRVLSDTTSLPFIAALLYLWLVS